MLRSAAAASGCPQNARESKEVVHVAVVPDAPVDQVVEDCGQVRILRGTVQLQLDRRLDALVRHLLAEVLPHLADDFAF